MSATLFLSLPTPLKVIFVIVWGWLGADQVLDAGAEAVKATPLQLAKVVQPAAEQVVMVNAATPSKRFFNSIKTSQHSGLWNVSFAAKPTVP